MKNNKLISILLALLVCLSMVVSASATETELSFTLESDSSVEALDAAVVGVGEEFSVQVNIASNPGILGATAYVVYDNTKLELVSAELVDGVSDVRVTTDTNAGKLAVIVGDINAIFGNPNNSKAVTTTGAVAELTFKVLVEADDQLEINLEVNSGFVVDADGEFGNLTINGDVLNVNVVSDEHKCDETKTIEANAVEPTCTEAGKKADLLCAHCGKVLTEGEEIPANDHAWGEWVVTTPSTCEAFGVQTRTCTVCGETETDESVPLAEHTFGNWTVKTPATTEAEGVEARTCSVCGKEETQSIAKLPPVEKPEPKSNTLLIVIIVVVVLAGAGVAAYFVLKNKKK